MTAAGGLIVGQQIGNQVRKADEKRRLEQEQAQRYQQICQQTPVYIPDKFEFVSQVPQSPLNRPYSPRFGSDTEDEGTYNPLTDPIKKRKANEARGRWRDARDKPSVSDKTKRELLYDRYNQEEKARKSERGVARNSTLASGVAGAATNAVFHDPTFSVGVAVGTAVAGVTEPAGVAITNIADGIYKAVRPKSPTRPNITKKVDSRMKKLEAEREQKREIQRLKEEREARLKAEREERLRKAAESTSRSEQTKKSSSWFSW